MFQRARIKLTLWYVYIAFIITAFFTILAYNGFRFEFERGLQQQREEFEGQQVIIQQPAPNVIYIHRPDPQIIQDIRQRVWIELLIIDGIIILISAVGGYFLAGQTLKPIQTMLDEQHRFITDASHELKTPLTALRSEIEVYFLGKHHTTKDAETILKSNLEEVINLQTLSENLMTLATTQKLKDRTYFEKIALQIIIDDALKKVIPLAKGKDITIETDADQIFIEGDKQRLTELFVILFDNAIKYSSEKTSITVKAKSVDHSAKIEISDEGVGIDEKDIPHIFDRFYRVDKSRSKKDVPGYGLGLSIAKEIVHMHNGTISVKSTLQKGTTFILHLPIVHKTR